MEFRVLGTLEIRDSAGRLLASPRRKQRLLLAVLLLRANTPVSTETLLDLLWPAAAPSSARANLHSYVSDLRRLLHADEQPRLWREAGGYQLRVGPDELDVAAFERLAGEGRQALAERRHAHAAEQLTQALACWRGPVLEDLPPPAALRPEAERLDELRMVVLEDSIEARLELAEPALLATELTTLTARHPLRERLWAHLMLALYRAGRQADALHTYQRVYRLLDEELGVEPGEQLRQLHQRILAADPDLTPAAPTLVRTPRQLPVPPPMYTGRADELARLERVQDASTVVISAIDGMAGIGKTALAVHVAHQVADRYPDGQLFIDLHGHTPGMAPVEPADALDRALRALGIPAAQIPAGLDERAALYRTRVADQRMLVVLDNAATEDQVTPLLPGAPGCLVLVTSRRRLTGLDHTHTLSLDVLPTPDAVALFVGAAGADRLRDQPADLVVTLVGLCGRLPLAIRIAAARLRSHPAWSLADLVTRLGDHRQRLAELDTGQRSVTAALDLSYAHLSPDQQHAYRLVGSHPGPDIDVYATAALLDSDVAHAGRLLDQLLDAHLLQEPVAGRFRFHDLTRAHAAALGRETGAMARLFDHYRHTASLAMDAAYPYEREQRPQVPPARTPRPDLPDAAAALGWLAIELPNLLAVARYAADHDMPAHVTDLSTILRRHLRSRARNDDAETLHQQALRVARATGDRAGEVDALTGLGRNHWTLGRYEQATADFEEALGIARATGNPLGEVDALTGLGRIDWMRGRYERATEDFEEALGIARTTGNQAGEVDALTGLGHIHLMQRRHTEATGAFEEALRVARATDHRLGELNALNGLGSVHWTMGRHEQATGDFEQALRIARTTGDHIGELGALNNLGHMHRLQGRHTQATDHYQRLLELAEDSGDRNFEFEARQGLGRLRHAAGDPAGAITMHDQALTVADELGQPVDQARAHDGLAHAHDALGQHEQARRHWQQALDILTGLGIDDTDDEETTVAAIRTHLAGEDRSLGESP